MVLISNGGGIRIKDYHLSKCKQKKNEYYNICIKNNPNILKNTDNELQDRSASILSGDKYKNEDPNGKTTPLQDDNGNTFIQNSNDYNK